MPQLGSSDSQFSRPGLTYSSAHASHWVRLRNTCSGNSFKGAK